MSRYEAKTRKELIDPKLKSSGWFNHDRQVDPEYKITAGRIHFDGKSATRSKPVYADYLLRYSSSLAIAVVEAKAEDKHYLEGEKQAKDYAQKLGLQKCLLFFRIKSLSGLVVIPLDLEVLR